MSGSLSDIKKGAGPLNYRSIKYLFFLKHIFLIINILLQHKKKRFVTLSDINQIISFSSGVVLRIF